MGIRINCDACYKDLSLANEKEYTQFVFAPYEEMAGARRSKTMMLHFCNACLIKDRRINIYIDNPYYVAPPPEPKPEEPKEE